MKFASLLPFVASVWLSRFVPRPARPTFFLAVVARVHPVPGCTRRAAADEMERGTERKVEGEDSRLRILDPDSVERPHFSPLGD